MSRYFLDTHVIGWLLSNDPKLNEHIKEDIEYPSGNRYFTSEYVILELLHLKQLGKLSVTADVKDLFSMLQARNVEIELVSPKVFESLLDLPVLTIKKKSHSDIDRKSVV